MAINNLYANYCYPSIPASGLPIVVVIHGYGGGAYDVSGLLDRMARYGVFAIGPGMRGRNGAGGAPDASGREIYDIYDAIEKVKADYAGFVDPDHVCVAGYSGGGGNALAFACKFPDYANVIVSHFGIGDYGWADVTGSGLDAAWGWYPMDSVNEAIGGVPNDVPNRYRARNAVEAIGNFSGGHLYLYHDTADAGVPVIHSQRIVTALGENTNFTANYTGAGDSPRWIHGDPIVGNSGEPCIQTEPIWLQAVANKYYSAWTIPASGTVTVIGYIKTKRFSIWLNTNGTTPTGIDGAATVAYNTGTDTYTVTPLTTGGLDVSITQGIKTGSATNITGATQIVVS